MQGFVLCELQDYVQKTFGFNIWEEFAKKVGIENKNYSLFESYPDEEFYAILDLISKHSGKNKQETVEEFGCFMAPRLWRICKRVIPEDWDILDLLENMAGFSQNLLAHAISGSAAPPIMRCLRTRPDEVTIFYNSPRKLCFFGKGIIRGLGKMYNSKVQITEPSCLLRGDDQCKIIFRITPGEEKKES